MIHSPGGLSCLHSEEQTVYTQAVWTRRARAHERALSNNRKGSPCTRLLSKKQENPLAASQAGLPPSTDRKSGRDTQSQNFCLPKRDHGTVPYTIKVQGLEARLQVVPEIMPIGYTRGQLALLSLNPRGLAGYSNRGMHSHMDSNPKLMENSMCMCMMLHDLISTQIILHQGLLPNCQSLHGSIFFISQSHC